MDAVEDVSEIGLCVESVQLGGYNDRHGAGEGFRSGISLCEELVLSAYADWAQSTFR